MRTQEEIISRIELVRKHDMFGFEVDELYRALDFEHAKPFLKDGVAEKDWTPDLLTDEAVIKQIVEYMDFAIEKATGHRGISASRSVAHYIAWLWLIGDDQLVKFAEDHKNYRNYGAPVLKKIAEKYGAKLPGGSDGKIFNAMAKGEVCPECASGDGGGCGE